MKREGHPPYQKVLFVDTSTGFKVLVACSMTGCKDREVIDGVEYPVCKVSVSSSSHSFFTGSNKLVDSEGRIGRFRNKYVAKAAAAAAAVQKVDQIEKDKPKKKKK